jgi:hypothetical protein
MPFKFTQSFQRIYHRIKGLFLLLILVAASVFTFNNCAKNDHEEEKFYRFKVNSADSIWNYYSENKSSLAAWYLS